MKTKLLFIVCALFALMGNAQPFAPDTTFGINGKAACEFGNENNFLSRMALQPDGKFVACGYYEFNVFSVTNRTRELALARFNADGSLDETFGTSGKVRMPFMATAEFGATAIKILPDGKILALCYKQFEIESYLTHAVLVKLNADGSPDNTFGTNGVLEVDPDAAYSFADALDIQADGKIVIGGRTGDWVTAVDFAVYRLNADGSRDTTFGTNGLFSANWGSNASPLPQSFDEIHMVKIMSDGSIFAAGDTAFTEEGEADYSGKFVVYKLNANGSLVSNFGTNGRIFANYPQFRAHILRSIEVSQDEKITIAGICSNYNDSNSGIATVRYNADGSFDNTYGTAGKTYFSNGMEYPRFAVFSSILRNDGKLLMVGSGSDLDTENSGVQSIRKSMLMQLNADGTVDNSFSANGLYWSALADINGEATTWDFVRQPDDKIVLGGWFKGTDGRRKMGLWRFTPTALAAETFTANSFSVTPNPFKDHIYIRSSQIQNQILSVDLIDISGRNISNLTRYEPWNQGQNTGRLNVPETLPNGIYILQINNGKNTTNIKIVK